MSSYYTYTHMTATQLRMYRIYDIVHCLMSHKNVHKILLQLLVCGMYICTDIQT